MTKQARKNEVRFPNVPGKARNAKSVARWELEELWSITSELCGGRDPHQVMWDMLHRRAEARGRA